MKLILHLVQINFFCFLILAPFSPEFGPLGAPFKSVHIAVDMYDKGIPNSDGQWSPEGAEGGAGRKGGRDIVDGGI